MKNLFGIMLCFGLLMLAGTTYASAEPLGQYDDGTQILTQFDQSEAVLAVTMEIAYLEPCVAVAEINITVVIAIPILESTINGSLSQPTIIVGTAKVRLESTINGSLSQPTIIVGTAKVRLESTINGNLSQPDKRKRIGYRQRLENASRLASIRLGAST